MLQTYLIEELLEDEELASLEKNKGGLFFPTQSGDPVYLSKDPEKKYYAYYSAALTSYLLGDEAEAEERVDQAGDISIPTALKSEVNRLMKYDIQILQEQDRFNAKAGDFKNEFLNQEEIELVAATGGKTGAKAGKAGGTQATTLPSTGGTDSVALLGLATALLVVGGLLVRGIVR
jgi:hypothetical protein